MRSIMGTMGAATALLLMVAVCCVLCEDEEEEKEEAPDGLSYLAKFGYIDSFSLRGLDPEGDAELLENAVKDFQHFAGIELTGKLDKVTLQLMQLPRCGVRDTIGAGAESRRRRRRRYALEGSRWRKPVLTWAITKYPENQKLLTNQQVDEAVDRALEMWGAVSSLKFQRVPVDEPKIDIDISFSKRAHGDEDPFDGPGGVLAHAYFPQYGGDMHVDDEENWSMGTTKGTNLLQAILHELGHSLGLSHSNVQESIMAPFYRGYDPEIALKDDDISALRALYGTDEANDVGAAPAPATASPTRPPQPPADKTPNEICNADFALDAIFRTIDNRTFVFSGRKFWQLNDKGIEPGYPQSISARWAGLPTNIDAAFTWPNNNATYFFKGSQYWKFVNMVPQPGFPKDLSVGFPGIPPNIDAVFLWAGNGKIYFTKGNQFWKFDPDAKPYVRPDKYPASLSVWGLEGPLSSAFQWNNGNTYFFKNDVYWRFDDLKFTVAEDTTYPFPRKTGPWWYACDP